MNARMAMVGAYSMSNYGDQLYPQLLAAMGREQAVTYEIEHYALLPGRLEDGQHIHALRDLPSTHPLRVLVGGGDLIRPDRRTVALDHLEVPTQQRQRHLRNRVRAELFARRWMLPGPGAWLPSAGWGADHTVLASVGVHELHPGIEMSRALAQVDRAWVRTTVAAERLTAAGLQGDRVVVAPDVAFAIADLLDVPHLRQRGEQLLAQVAAEGPVVVLQVAGFHGWDERRLVSLLRSLDEFDVAVLPLGRYAGENVLLRRAAELTGSHYLGALNATDMTAVLAAAGSIVTTSMHAAIIATCFGTPVVVPGVEKTASAFSACPDPPVLTQSSDEAMKGLLHEVNGHLLPPPGPSNATAVRAAFREVWDALSG